MGEGDGEDSPEADVQKVRPERLSSLAALFRSSREELQHHPTLDTTAFPSKSITMAVGVRKTPY
jgi:hypothetical protein